MQKVQEIIRRARGEKNQFEFGQFLGKSQGLVSKYERGIVSPPADVLEKCLGILQLDEREDVNIDILVKRVRGELKAPQFAYVRRTIAAMLDGIRNSKAL